MNSLRSATTGNTRNSGNGAVMQDLPTFEELLEEAKQAERNYYQHQIQSLKAELSTLESANQLLQMKMKIMERQIRQ